MRRDEVDPRTQKKVSGSRRTPGEGQKQKTPRKYNGPFAEHILNSKKGPKRNQVPVMSMYKRKKVVWDSYVNEGFTLIRR